VRWLDRRDDAKGYYALLVIWVDDLSMLDAEPVSRLAGSTSF
jgi:hypothetical protein